MAIGKLEEEFLLSKSAQLLEVGKLQEIAGGVELTRGDVALYRIQNGNQSGCERS